MNNINRDVFTFSKELQECRQFLEWKNCTYPPDKCSQETDKIGSQSDKNNNSSEILLLTPEETASRLSIGRTVVYKLIANGSLESVTIGNSRRIPTDCLKKFVDSLKAKNHYDSDSQASNSSTRTKLNQVAKIPAKKSTLSVSNLKLGA